MKSQSMKAKGAWLPIQKAEKEQIIPKPGWLVLFNFREEEGRNADAQHVGILETVNAAGIQTIEFNTSDENQLNGGAVARRSRNYESVLGYIATY